MAFDQHVRPAVPSAAHVRIARPSRDLVAAERFWTHGLGLQVLWRTVPASDGEHALLMVGWPQAGWHLELVGDEDVSPSPTEEDLLVLYLDGAVPDELVQQLCEAGGRLVQSRNPYWDDWGVTIEDPDGYRLVLCRRQWTNAIATSAGSDRVVSATRDIKATTALIFELLADPSQHPRWDGNDNLSQAEPGQRVRAVGDVFTMRLMRGSVRDNHVVEFAEGRLLAWRPAEVDGEPIGHLWRWELEPLHESLTRVTHTYDWTQLTDESRIARAEWTTAQRLAASLDRLAALAERSFVEDRREPR